MLNRRRRILLSTAVVLAVAGRGAAEAEIGLGVRAGLVVDGPDPLVGIELVLPVYQELVWFNPNVEAAFGDDRDLVSLNLDFHYDFDVDSRFYIWAGGGPAIVRREVDRPRASSSTEGAFNLLVGAGLAKFEKFVPYAQAKVALADETEAVLVVGLRF